MTNTRSAALVFVVALFGYLETAKAGDDTNSLVATLKKENAALRQQNSELRRRLEITPRSEANPTSHAPMSGSAKHMVKATEEESSKEAIHTWTGWYAGANVGYGWGNAHSNVNDPHLSISPILVSQHPNGPIGGGQIGYNWQINEMLVMGLETDFQASSAKTGSSTTNPDVNFGLITHSRDAKINWFGTLRGRAGVLITPSVLLYGSGGLVYGNIGAGGAATFPCVGCSVVYGFSDNSSTKFGFAVGAGVEAVVPNTSNWHWRAEYLYLDFGHPSVSGTTLDVYAPGTLLAWSMTLTDNIVRVGFNYQFH